MKEKEFIHLCQPDSCKSCGACCGAYNYADSSREALTEKLRQRTRLFHERVRGPEDLADFSALLKSLEPQEKLYEVIYCCEYLGFLDKEEQKVGCLLHPMQNNGQDLRDVSFYGKELCDGHFCPSYHHISREEKLAVIDCIDDWYLYGLCITDIDLVKEYFRFIIEILCEVPKTHLVRQEPLKASVCRFFQLKVSWPFRSADANRFGKYYFDGSQYMISHIDYDGLGCERSRFDKIFMSLTSHFNTKEEIEVAEDSIQAHIDDFVSIYRQLCH